MLRCSYANSLLMPVALAKFRLWEPLMRKAPASGVQPVAPWLDRILLRAAGGGGGMARGGQQSAGGAIADTDRGEDGVTDRRVSRR